MKTSLIISTYNRPDALSVILDSVKKLNTLPDEVIVGDDGSTEETAEVVKAYQKDFPVPLHYIYQEDRGFRVAKIRNKCIAKAGGEYIIQIDGDIFLHPDFIKDHIENAREGCFLKGGRVQLGEALTKEICADRKSRPIKFFTSGIEKKRANTLRNRGLGKYLAPRYRKNRDNVLGCNMSFFKKDFVKVNGYDESFEGWGGEDLDFSFRLRNAGVDRRYLKFCGLTYHLWHREAPKDRSDENHAVAYSNRENGVVRAKKGVDRYLGEDNV